MSTININKLGFAFGTTFALLYVGCVLVMLTVGREGTIFFFNSLMHGVDVTSILRTNMPFYEMALGVMEVFILGWLVGATIASLYNVSFRSAR